MNDKKELIRRAAIKIMAREGFYNTRPLQIAEEAGIAVGTIYNYFRSKEEILEYIFEKELGKRLKYIQEAKESPKNFWTKIKRFLDRHYEEIKKNPDVGKILVREKEFSRKDGSKAISDYLNKIPRGIEDLLEDAIASKEISQHDTISLFTL